MTPSSFSVSISCTHSSPEQSNVDSFKEDFTDLKIKKNALILAKLEFAPNELPFDTILKKSESKSELSSNHSSSSPRITVSPRVEENTSAPTTPVASPSHFGAKYSPLAKSLSAPSVSVKKSFQSPIHTIHEENDLEESNS